MANFLLRHALVGTACGITLRLETLNNRGRLTVIYLTSTDLTYHRWRLTHVLCGTVCRVRRSCCGNAVTPTSPLVPFWNVRNAIRPLWLCIGIESKSAGTFQRINRKATIWLYSPLLGCCIRSTLNTPLRL